MPALSEFKYLLQKIKPVLVPLWLMFGVYLTHFYSDTLFHFVAGMFTITVGYGIFIFGYTTRNLVKEPYTQFLSVAFLFIISFDLIHLLAYPRIHLFIDGSENLALQAHLVARSLEAGALLAATWFVGNHIRWKLAWAAFGTIFWVTVASIFYWQNFPTYLANGRLTPFALASEALVTLLFALTFVRLCQKRAAFDAEVFNWLVVAVGASVLAELRFLFFDHTSGNVMITEHLLKVFAFYAFYRAMVFTGITKPFALLLRTEKEHKEALAAEVAARTAELRASERRYRRLTERLPDLVYRYHWKEPRGYTYMNPATEQITGYKPEDFYANPNLFFDITHPDDRVWWTRYREDIMDFPWYQPIKSRIIHKDGHLVWTEERIVPIFDDSGELVAIESIIRDITAQKQAEEALKHRANQMSLLYRTGTLLNASLDLDVVLSTLLTELEQLFHMLGGEIWLVDFKKNDLVCHAASHHYQKSVIGKRMPLTAGFAGATIEARKTLIISNAATDPRYFPLFDKEYAAKINMLVNVPLRVRQRIIGVIQIGAETDNSFSDSDVQFLESIAGIAAIAIENARLYRQAIDDAQTKLTLLKEVNHRVKNNLAAISGLLYLEKRKMGKLLDETYEQSIENLISRVQGLAAVHNLLSAAEWRPVPLKVLVGDIVRTTIRATTHHPVSVRVSAPEVEIQSEQAHHLGLIINELTINSLKHASPAEQTLKINVTAVESGDIITLTFRDNGRGYPPEILQQRSQPGHIGFDLLTSIVRKNLSGECRFFNDDGAVSEIIFKPDVLTETTRW